MDVEITRKNGETFRLSDYDVQAQDFNVSSIELMPTYGSIEGRSGAVDYGADYGGRTISVPFYLRAYDMHDYPLLRDELFSLVTTKESFYIRELRRPSEFTNCDDGYDDRYVGGKRYLVRLSNVIDLDQQRTYGFGEMVFETTELPFAESIGTSADIDNPELIPLIPDLWTQGYWALDTGGAVHSVSNVRTNTDLKISLNPETEYELSSLGDYEARVNIYSPQGDLLTYYHSGKDTSRKFTTPKNTSYGRMTIRQYQGNENINPSMIGKEIKISMKKTTSGINSEAELWGFGMGLISDDDSLIYTHTGTEFKIFNPGIEVHPFEQDLTIEISDVVGSTSYLQLENRTTGDAFRVTEAVNGNQLIKLDGPNITSNNLQYLRKTNRKYITLAPGWNNFRISGATSAKVSFDTRFYYL